MSLAINAVFKKSWCKGRCTVEIRRREIEVYHVPVLHRANPYFGARLTADGHEYVVAKFSTLLRHLDGALEKAGLTDTEVAPINRIPIAAAKKIADDYGQQQVVIVTWDGTKSHVVTYGRTILACQQAAQGGNKVKAALGWPPEACNAVPPRAKRRVTKQGGV